MRIHVYTVDLPRPLTILLQAMTCAILTYLYPQHADLFKVGYVGSLATKLSDTCGSEIGKAYGKTT